MPAIRHSGGIVKRQLSADEIKSTELNILLEFDRICTEHNLDYVLAYGTCLGALRHQGFIPWDDDIDVCMPRDSYEKLFEIFQQGVDTPYQLVTHRDGSSIYQFFKLIDPNTESYETFVGKKHPIGLWIDIFPLDRCNPDAADAFDAIKRKNERIGLKRSFTVTDTSVASTPAIKLVKKIVCPFARALYDVADLNRKLEDLALELPQATGADTNAAIDEGAYCDFLGGDMHVMDASLLFPAARAMFEGHSLPVPARAKEYLTLAYGDWHALPPEDQRHLHFPEAYALEKE